MFCTTVVPAPKGHLGGPATKHFYMIHRGGRTALIAGCMPSHIHKPTSNVHEPTSNIHGPIFKFMDQFLVYWDLYFTFTNRKRQFIIFTNRFLILTIQNLICTNCSFSCRSLHALAFMFAVTSMGYLVMALGLGHIQEVNIWLTTLLNYDITTIYYYLH